jgi:hypothetical protein
MLTEYNLSSLQYNVELVMISPVGKARSLPLNFQQNKYQHTAKDDVKIHTIQIQYTAGLQLVKTIIIHKNTVLEEVARI